MTEQDFRKKIFFIYPNSFIRNEIIFPLIDREYEIYVIDDHKLISCINSEYSNSLIFLNIDEKLTPAQWEKLIRANLDLHIGVMTYNENTNTELKYRSFLQVSCGYNSLRKRPEELLSNIINTLKNFNVKEKRKFIRIRFRDSENRFETNFGGQKRTGYVHDLSSVGMTLLFDKPFKIEKNSRLNDISLYIYESVIQASGIFMGAQRHEKGGLLYVIIFDNNMKESSRSRIRLIINRNMQKNLIDQIRKSVVGS